MMELVNNCGSHDIVIFADCRFNPANRKMAGGHEVARIPFSGTMLGVKKIDKVLKTAKVNGFDIPLTKVEIESIDPVPDDGAFHIVSALYASAVKDAGMDTSRILTTANPVVAEDGRTILGCANLQVW